MSNAIEITGHNVLTAAKERLMWIFDTFDKICLSFSGGKDSTVLYHLAAEISRIKRKSFQSYLLTGKYNIILPLDMLRT